MPYKIFIHVVSCKCRGEKSMKRSNVETNSMSSDLFKSYQEIAPFYLEKKRGIWRDLDQFLKSQEILSSGMDITSIHHQAGVILDLGGGNGRNLPLINSLGNHSAVLVDFCKSFLKKPESPCYPIRGDIRHLPLRKCNPLLILSIACLHHLFSNEDILQTLLEIRREMTESTIFLASFWISPSGNYKEGIYFHPWKNSDATIISHRAYNIQSISFWEAHVKKADLYLLVSHLAGGTGKDNLFLVSKRA